MEFLIIMPVLLFSVVVHEVAHALVAKWEGDDTAFRLGRVTLNPIPHLDPMGSLIVPLFLYLLPGDFVFGWAKPVPVNPGNFRDPKWSDIRVSLAGIAANLILAFISTVALVVILKVDVYLGASSPFLGVLFQAASFGLLINLILAFFNLIPIPPLDGSHVVFHLLPRHLAMKYRDLGRYGIGILMLLLFFFPGSFEILLWPVRLLVSVAEMFIGIWV
jgi:Zn-dependent protease